MQLEQAAPRLLALAIFFIVLAPASARAQQTPLPPMMLNGRTSVGGSLGGQYSAGVGAMQPVPLQRHNPPCSTIAALPDWLPSICADWWDAWKTQSRGLRVSSEELKRAQTCTWEIAGCADFFPEYSKRELPDTPDNECHGLV